MYPTVLASFCLKKMKPPYQPKRREMTHWQVLLLHDNAKPHTTAHSTEMAHKCKKLLSPGASSFQPKPLPNIHKFYNIWLYKHKTNN